MGIPGSFSGLVVQSRWTLGNQGQEDWMGLVRGKEKVEVLLERAARPSPD